MSGVYNTQGRDDKGNRSRARSSENPGRHSCSGAARGHGPRLQGWEDPEARYISTPISLLEGDESRGGGSTDPSTPVPYRLVCDGELSKIVSHHLGLHSISTRVNITLKRSYTLQNSNVCRAAVTSSGEECSTAFLPSDWNVI